MEDPKSLEKQLSVMVSPTFYARLRDLAALEQRSLSQYTRRLIEEALAAREAA